MNKDLCPICNIKGLKVPTTTVKSLVNSDKDIKGSDYHLCIDQDCSVGYFDNEVGDLINHKNLNVDIWYKLGVDPKIICYCLNIREEEIFITAIETGIKQREQMTYYLRSRLGDSCLHENPLGKCCENSFNESIKKALKLKEALKNSDSSHPLYDRYKNLKLDSIYVSPDELEAPEQSCSDSCSGSCNH